MCVCVMMMMVFGVYRFVPNSNTIVMYLVIFIDLQNFYGRIHVRKPTHNHKGTTKRPTVPKKTRKKKWNQLLFTHQLSSVSIYFSVNIFAPHFKHRRFCVQFSNCSCFLCVCVFEFSEPKYKLNDIREFATEFILISNNCSVGLIIFRAIKQNHSHIRNMIYFNQRIEITIFCHSTHNKHHNPTYLSLKEFLQTSAQKCINFLANLMHASNEWMIHLGAIIQSNANECAKGEWI